MKFLGFNIGKEKGLEVKEGYQSFSSPFMNVGEGNLSLPYVNARQQVNGYIRFGADNLYPQLINQLYYTSPLHSAIVDFKVNATIGGGYELKVDANASAMEKVDVYSFEKRIKLDRVLEALTKDDVMHNRVYFKLRFNEIGDLIEIKHVGAEKVRKDKFGNAYFLCYDWSSQIDIETIYPYNVRRFQKECLYIYEKQCVGQDVYPLPSYTSAFNWAFLDGEMSYLQKSNILNSIFPSFAILFPKKPQSEEEKNAIRKTVEQGKGARNGGKTLAFFANAKDQLPEIQAIPTNANDNLFQTTTESIDSKICQAHTIDPILMGIRVSGKLGSGSDIKQSYTIFEKNVIIPQKNRIERIVNELFKIGKVKAEFSLNSYAIINDVITERDEKTQKLVDSINSLPQNIQATVLGKMTDAEIRSLVGLETKENQIITETPAQ